MNIFKYLPHLGYSRDLHKQLLGVSVNCDGYRGTAVYQVTFIVLLVVSFIIMLNYYYGLFNQPRATHRWVWLANMLTASAIVGCYAWTMALRGLPEARHCKDLYFTRIDCTLFAFTAMIYTAIFCFIFSILLKWKSIANKKIPF